MLYLIENQFEMMLLFNLCILTIVSLLLWDFWMIAKLKNTEAVNRYQKWIMPFLILALTTSLTYLGNTYGTGFIYEASYGLRQFLILSLCLLALALGVRSIWKRRSIELIESRNFYKIFKFVFVQLNAGASRFQVFKALHKVVDDMRMSEVLLRFSAMLSQQQDEIYGFEYLSSVFKSENGVVFVDVLRNIDKHYQGIESIEHMLFNQYLSSLRAETKRIERHYITLVVLFTVMTTLLLLIPLLSSMAESAQNVFK